MNRVVLVGGQANAANLDPDPALAADSDLSIATQKAVKAAIANALAALTGPNIRFTEEGGIAFRLINATGAPSVKGQAINLNAALDNSYVAATEPYVLNGFVYEYGIADGELTWVVRDGVADILLVDGYAATPNNWVRLSPTVPGRCITQSMPGIDYPATALAYESGNGATISGSIDDLRLDNGVKLVIGGTTVAPSIDARLTFAGVTSLPSQLIANGYLAANRASGVTISVWDYVAGGGSWVPLADKFAAAGTVDTTITFTDLTADMLSGGEMRVRIYGADAGIALDRLYLDRLILRSSSDTEHFKECGHTLTTAEAGTDVLVRMNIHML